MYQELVLYLVCYGFLDLGDGTGQGDLGWAAVHNTAVLRTGGKPRHGISLKMTLVHLDLVCGPFAHVMWVVGAVLGLLVRGRCSAGQTCPPVPAVCLSEGCLAGTLSLAGRRLVSPVAQWCGRACNEAMNGAAANVCR